MLWERESTEDNAEANPSFFTKSNILPLYDLGMVVKKTINITDEQDQKIRTIQIRRMDTEKKAVSYSKVLQQAIDEGITRIQ